MVDPTLGESWAGYEAGGETTWDRISAAEQQRERDGKDRAVPPEEEPAHAMKTLIGKLQCCRSPVTFWLTMMQEAPRGAGRDALEAHRLFCKSMSDRPAGSARGRADLLQ